MKSIILDSAQAFLEASTERKAQADEPKTQNEGPLTNDVIRDVANGVVDTWKTQGLPKLLGALDGEKSVEMGDRKKTFAYIWNAKAPMAHLSTSATNDNVPGLDLKGLNDIPYTNVKGRKLNWPKPYNYAEDKLYWPLFSVSINVQIPHHYTYENMAEYVKHGLGKDVEALLDKYRRGIKNQTSFSHYTLRSSYECSVSPEVDVAKAEIRKVLQKAGAPKPNDIDVELDDGRAYAHVAKRTVMFLRGKQGWKLADPKLFASWFK